MAAHCGVTHIELREAVVQFLTAHHDEYLEFFSNDESLVSYIQQIASAGAWGDNLSLLVMAEILQSPIHVAQRNPSNNIGSPIWIAYNGYSHYGCVFASGTPVDSRSK